MPSADPLPWRCGARHIVGAPAVGPHGRQGQDLGAGLADRGFQSHPFDHRKRGAADIDRVPADPQLGHSLNQDRPVAASHQPIRQGRAGDAHPREETSAGAA
jgi:hypothetical protein